MDTAQKIFAKSQTQNIDRTTNSISPICRTKIAIVVSLSMPRAANSHQSNLLIRCCYLPSE